jgi:hypothetical protein
MKIWFNRNYSSIAFILQELQKNNQITTLLSHIREVEYKHFADQFIYEPEHTDDYLGFCLEVCKQKKIDVFYPWRDFALLYPHRDKFADLNVKVIFSCSDENFHVIDNKALFYQHLLNKNIKFNLPLFATANTKAEFVAHYNALRTHTDKLCMKPCVSVYAAGFKVIHDEKDYSFWEALLEGKDKHDISYANLIQLLPPDLQKEMMLLDYLPGNEYSHDLLCRNGEIIAGTIRQKYHEHDKYQLLVQNSEIERMSALLVKEFNLNAFINIQYRDDKNGVPFILEINPRISGGLPKVNLAGIDYVNLFVKILLNQEITPADVKQNFGLKIGAESRYIELS